MSTESTAATWLGTPPSAPAHPGEVCLPDGLDDQGRLGVGGMGEVRLAREAAFDRLVAVKIMSRAAAADADLRRRFLHEAQCMASLDHPAVVPVFRRGELADGRPWYSMRRVRGATLTESFAAETPPLTTSVAHLLVVAQALGHAHGEGLVHRDVTPNNVLLGPFGEVLLLDWGLAVRQGTPAERIMGTPGFVAPEQATLGAPQTAAVDVFALGRLLARVLGRVPVASAELHALVAACTRSSPEDRCGVVDVIDGLDRWLSGARARQRALALRQDGLPHRQQAVRDRARAERLRSAAQQGLAALPLDAPPDAKAAWWESLDEAETLQERAEDEHARWLQALHAALAVAPGLPEAHHDLADHHYDRFTEAIARHDTAASARHRRLLAVHDDGRHGEVLSGRREVRLATEPAAALSVRALVRRRRRLEVGDEVWQGTAGDAPVELPTGLLLVVAAAPGRPTVRWPLDARGALRAPPPSRDAVQRLPASLGDDEAWVAGGWFRSGGDSFAMEALSRRELWVDPFVMAVHPVTFDDYLGFLDDLWRRGRPEEAWARVPGIDTGGEVQPVAERTASGFVVAPRADGVPRRADEPVTMVTWHDAVAYAAWRAERDGLGWRLPHDQEWEKAARGTDGRPFPWGEHFEASWCRCVRTLPTPRGARIDEHPDDVSVYGVRGLAGNARAWCANPFHLEGPEDGSVIDPGEERGDPSYRTARGGSWSSEPDLCRSASRFAGRPDRRYTAVGIRLVRSDAS